jgi:hypothetical protein
LGQILVKVRNIAKDDSGQKSVLHGTETIITYKSFQYVSDRFELLYQCDENGVAIPGNPNLTAQHQQEAKESVTVVDAGPSQRELELIAEIERLKSLLSGQTNAMEVKQEPVASPVTDEPKPQAPAQERRKPGPKPKTNQPLQEIVA